MAKRRPDGCRFNSRSIFRVCDKAWVYQTVYYQITKMQVNSRYKCKGHFITFSKKLSRCRTYTIPYTPERKTKLGFNGLFQNLTIMIEDHLLPYTARCTNDLWLPETRKTSGKEWRMQQDVCCGYRHRYRESKQGWINSLKKPCADNWTGYLHVLTTSCKESLKDCFVTGLKLFSSNNQSLLKTQKYTLWPKCPFFLFFMHGGFYDFIVRKMSTLRLTSRLLSKK